MYTELYRLSLFPSEGKEGITLPGKVESSRFLCSKAFCSKGKCYNAFCSIEVRSRFGCTYNLAADRCAHRNLLQVWKRKWERSWKDDWGEKKRRYFSLPLLLLSEPLGT